VVDEASRVVRVRRAGGADAAALADLRWAWACERASPQRSYQEFVADFSAWVTGATTSHVPFLAEGPAGPVGMAWLAVVHRVPDVDRPVRQAGLVQSVYVQPDHRNVRIGHRLVESVVDHARSLGLDYLEVHPTVRSLPFYERLAFTATARTLRRRLDGGG
jgi:GNAT superfamily N-acetyltransferase